MMAQIQKTDKVNLNARKFNMWIFIFTSFMFFAALSSGFIVYSGGKGHGVNVMMPKAFIYSTIVLLVSSGTLFLASRAAKALEYGRQQLMLTTTIILGLAFLCIQVYAWYVLTFKMGIYFSNPNASRSFIYVFTGMHLLHILGGLVFLLAALTGSIKRIPQTKNLYRMEMAAIFWHFLDIIWIYLYVFLLLNQN